MIQKDPSHLIILTTDDEGIASGLQHVPNSDIGRSLVLDTDSVNRDAMLQCAQGSKTVEACTGWGSTLLFLMASDPSNRAAELEV